MKNRFFITIGVLFFITIVFVTYANMENIEDKKKERKIMSDSPLIQRQEYKSRTSSETNEVKDLLTEKEIKKLRRAVPLKNELKAEIIENPHQTPRSLVTFAEILGNLSDKAFANVTNADIFFDELDDCVANDEIAESARTLCLSKAERIAQKFPVLNDRLKDLKDRTPLSIERTLKKQKALIKN